ncbi:MAG: YbhB/YbcL family Raf kinase inhibitor-like protein [Halobacteriaceae archaeon]
MTLTLSSPAFGDGDPIPPEYGYTDRNVNPPLTFTGAPDDAVSLALVMDDPDAVEPAGKIWDHWVVWNIDPGRTEIPEDWDIDGNGAETGTNDYGERGYGGPNPPDGKHMYRFELYALDTSLDLSTDTDADALRDAIEGTVLETAALHGSYSP